MQLVSPKTQACHYSQSLSYPVPHDVRLVCVHQRWAFNNTAVVATMMVCRYVPCWLLRRFFVSFSVHGGCRRCGGEKLEDLSGGREVCAYLACLTVGIYFCTVLLRRLSTTAVVVFCVLFLSPACGETTVWESNLGRHYLAVSTGTSSLVVRDHGCSSPFPMRGCKLRTFLMPCMRCNRNQKRDTCQYRTHGHSSMGGGGRTRVFFVALRTVRLRGRRKFVVNWKSGDEHCGTTVRVDKRESSGAGERDREGENRDE